MAENKDQNDPTPLRSGDEEVFKFIFDRFYRRLVSFCNSHLHDRTQAEDIVSSIFEKLWRLKIDFETLKHLENYLFKAARKAIISWSKSPANSRITSLSFDYDEDAGEWAQQDPQDPHAFTSDHLHRKLIISVLRAIINELPEQAGKVARLRLIDQLTVEEIATHLNITKNTVYKHFASALEKIREELGNRGVVFLIIILLCIRINNF